MGFIYYIGARFINEYRTDSYEDVFVAIQVLFVAAIGTGMAIANVPSVGPA